ncbi:MAG: TerL [Proteobacteria bacterium]|nr:TerL [Pseudomonadota bacterium]
MIDQSAIDYTPDGATLRRFFHFTAFARFLVGPFGSGKSVACCMEIFRRAIEQEPGPGGVRRTRWLVIRNTYPQLKTTTIKTWRDWFDDRFGVFNWGPPPSHRLVLPLDDGTVADIEVLFLALDGPEAEAGLKGFEGTGVWFNEIREIPKSIVKFALGRIGRYPAVKDGGPTWYGAIADTNPPDTDHWLYAAAEEDTPDGWAFFKQPGGVMFENGKWVMNPEAENLKYLPSDYYLNQLAGQDHDWIKVYLGGEYGFSLDGKPVYPEFRDRTHTADDAFSPIPGLPLYIGLDFGLTPAAIFGQRTARGQWRICDEMTAEDMGVVRFSEGLGTYLDENYPDYQIESYGDPAGAARAQTDERTCIEIVKEYARIPCRPAPSNDFTLRRESVAGALNRLVDGDPGLLISPACRMLRKGFAGAYCYRRVQITGDERFRDKPEKDQYSHPHDALQYLLSGAGEGATVMRRTKRVHRPAQADTEYAIFR